MSASKCAAAPCLHEACWQLRDVNRVAVEVHAGGAGGRDAPVRIAQGVVHGHQRRPGGPAAARCRAQRRHQRRCLLHSHNMHDTSACLRLSYSYLRPEAMLVMFKS